MNGQVFSPIYEVGLLGQAAVLAFYGFGYNFYSVNNQIRKDDELVRDRACTLLNDLRGLIRNADAVYRRAHLRPPTRENPDPDPTALQNVQTVAEINGSIAGLETIIRSAPTPPNDLMLARFRSNTGLLDRLREHDTKIVGAVHIVLAKFKTCTVEWMIENEQEIRDAIAYISHLCQDRRDLISIIK